MQNIYGTDYECFWAPGTKAHEKSHKIIELYELILSFLQKNLYKASVGIF